MDGPRLVTPRRVIPFSPASGWQRGLSPATGGRGVMLGAYDTESSGSPSSGAGPKL